MHLYFRKEYASNNCNLVRFGSSLDLAHHRTQGKMTSKEKYSIELCIDVQAFQQTIAGQAQVGSC